MNGHAARSPGSPSDVTSDSEAGEEELNAPLMQEGLVPAGVTYTQTTEQVRTASLVYHHETTDA